MACWRASNVVQLWSGISHKGEVRVPREGIRTEKSGCLLLSVADFPVHVGQLCPFITQSYDFHLSNLKIIKLNELKCLTKLHTKLCFKIPVLFFKSHNIRSLVTFQCIFGHLSLFFV